LYPDHPAVVLLGLALMDSQTNFDEVVEGKLNDPSHRAGSDLVFQAFEAL
jgi:hypothetical protein